jgi:hypothetical protein
VQHLFDEGHLKILRVLAGRQVRWNARLLREEQIAAGTWRTNNISRHAIALLTRTRCSRASPSSSSGV